MNASGFNPHVARPAMHAVDASTQQHRVTAIPYPPTPARVTDADHNKAERCLVDGMDRVLLKHQMNVITQFDHLHKALEQMNQNIGTEREQNVQLSSIVARLTTKHEGDIRIVGDRLVKIEDALALNLIPMTESIVRCLSSIEQKLLRLEERTEYPKKDLPRIFVERCTSPHLGNVDVHRKEYQDENVGPRPIFVSKSASTELSSPKSYTDIGVGATATRPDATTSVYPTEQFDFTPFTPSKFLNAFQFGQDTVFKPQYEFPAYSGEPLIPALWPQSQTESGTVTPGTGLNNSREGSAIGTIDELRAYFGFPNPQPLSPAPSRRLNISLPSPPATQEQLIKSPETSDNFLPKDDFDDPISDERAIDTALIFGSQNEGPEPASELPVPKVSGFDVSFRAMSPFSSISSVEGQNEESSEILSTGSKALKRKRGVRTSTAASRKSVKKPKTRASSAENVIWPPIMTGIEEDRRNFIQCDKCLSWYHYGCVGIVGNDSRNDDEESAFECPPCGSRDAQQLSSIAGDQSKRCSRPRCDLVDPDDYFIEKLVGRRWKRGLNQFQWLVKWDGWPMDESTWQVVADMGFAASKDYIARFMAEAQEEGIDFDVHDDIEVILLAKARGLNLESIGVDSG